MRVDALLAHAGAVHGARTALEGPQGTQTFAELADRVFRLAAGLRRLGLEPGDRVLDLQPVADHAEVLAAQDAARRVHASKPLRDYIVTLIRRTRDDERVELVAEGLDAIGVLVDDRHVVALGAERRRDVPPDIAGADDDHAH